MGLLVKHDEEDKHENAEIVQEVEVADEQRFGEKDIEKFPEGGQGWVVLAGTFLVLSTTFGMVNTFGVYQTYYEERFPETQPAVISLIGALQPTMIYIASLPVITLIKVIGVNYTILIGSSIMVVSLMLMSLCKQLWQFYLTQGVLFGIGAGIAYFTALAIPPEWFKRRRALAIGITVTGSSIGGVVWPIAFQRLVNEVGFPWANRIIGFTFIPILAFSTFFVRSRPGLPKSTESTWPDWRVLKDWRFALTCVANMLGLFGLFPPMFFITTYSAKLGASANVSRYILAMINAMTIVGRIIVPLLADKFGRLNVLIPSVFLTGLFQFVLWLPAKNSAMLLAFAALWGSANGTYIALVPPAIGQLFGIKGNKSRLSMCLIISVPGCLAGPTIAGAFVKAGDSSLDGYRNIGIYGGSIMMMTSFLFLVLRLSYSFKLRVYL